MPPSLRSGVQGEIQGQSIRKSPAMMKIEHYWPSEILERVFPDRFGPNARKEAAERERAGAARGQAYTVESVEGGCEVIRLPLGRTGKMPRR